MKKIAFYVEGRTEQLFINKLLIEVAGQKNIQIELRMFQGAGAESTKEIHPKTCAMPINPNHHALILDCAGDGSVKSRILEDYQKLFNTGYQGIIGVLDLYPKPDLARFKQGLINGLPDKTDIVIAIKEIEAWFLAECSHFERIDAKLTPGYIELELKFNPCVEDMSLRDHPAEDLHKIYQLVGQSYLVGPKKTKKKNRIEKTVECLDYANIYLSCKKKISELNVLISKIDQFLT